MARRREDAGRQPQFTESHYEIPSWQTPWSKPWYQRNDSSNSDQNERAKAYKYNARGHLIDCTCCNCEEDLETAFYPQSNPNKNTLFDIPNDRREEIEIENIDDDGEDDLSSPTKPQNLNGSSFPSSGNNSHVPIRVYKFSELPEVTQTTSNGTSITTRSSNASSSRPSGGTTSTLASNGSSSTHDSVMDGFGKITAIQAISDHNKDIQTRVRDYKGKSDTQEYKTMKELLESLSRELNRINSSIEWVATTKTMALEAVQKTLATLEQKVKDAES